ncbi:MULTISPECIES: hypothetical protein [unclassified Clostridium]|uniref:hypothetical protein n=1 Tax=unclassified Clostridium TaxID=2614128 RepID=UPI0025BD8944|nr:MULTISPECIES: hypothetical protein [unclassified Clostridium]
MYQTKIPFVKGLEKELSKKITLIHEKPKASNSKGNIGECFIDDAENKIYICTKKDTWKTIVTTAFTTIPAPEEIKDKA